MVGPKDSAATVTGEFEATPREVLAAVMRQRPRRFHLVRANASEIHLRCTGSTAGGVEQGLAVHMDATDLGTMVEVFYPGSFGPEFRDEIYKDFMASLQRSVSDGRNSALFAGFGG